MDWTSTGPAVLASFLASMVECVEALTIVLAVGTVRGWRPALSGAGSALAVMAILVLTLGKSLARIPIEWVQVGVGTLLLLFGLRWLRKAVLRSAGVIALHDEAQAFEKETASLRAADGANVRRFDRTAFMTAFKITMLEGLEVVFIVIALSSGGRLMGPAIAGALLALASVIALGFLLHRPLTRVPENTLKFGVGVMLSGFGTFWVGEGLGLNWPGADLAIVALTALFLMGAIALVPMCRRQAQGRQSKPIRAVDPRPTPTPLASAWSGLIGFFVDDLLLAVGTIMSLLIAWALVAAHAIPVAGDCLLLTIGLMSTLVVSALKRSRA